MHKKYDLFQVQDYKANGNFTLSANIYHLCKCFVWLIIYRVQTKPKKLNPFMEAKHRCKNPVFNNKNT